MSDTTSTTASSSDAELISAVRSGDTEAYGELFDRHRDAALRLSRQLVPGPDADDLVSESFTRVLAILQGGKGPDESFRAYLLTSIRRLHIDRMRTGKRVKTTDDEAELDRAVAFVDPAEMKFEQGAAAAAFTALPERWQLVLWHLDVEGQKPADIAPLLGMSANSVSALAYRAREGLRQAYLQGHLAPPIDDNCRWTTGQLGSYVRKGLAARDTAKVDAHLDECSRCTGLYLELKEVNSNLAGLLGPALLGTAAAGYLGGGSAAAVGLAAVGAKGLLARIIDVILTPAKAVGASAPQAAVATVVVGTIAAGGLIAIVRMAPDDSNTSTQPVVAPSRTPPTSPDPTPTTTPSSTPTPTPTPTPTVVPTDDPTTAPAPIAAVDDPATPEPTPSSDPTPTPTPTPSDPPASADVDLSVTGLSLVSTEGFLRRTATVSFGPTSSSQRKDLKVVLAFVAEDGDGVRFRGQFGNAWNCDDPSDGALITRMTCTRANSTFPVPALRFSIQGNLPTVTATISAAGNDDPSPGNNSMTKRADKWVHP